MLAFLTIQTKNMNHFSSRKFCTINTQSGIYDGIFRLIINCVKYILRTSRIGGRKMVYAVGIIFLGIVGVFIYMLTVGLKDKN